MQHYRLSIVFIILLYMKQEELGMVYTQQWPGLTEVFTGHCDSYTGAGRKQEIRLEHPHGDPGKR